MLQFPACVLAPVCYQPLRCILELLREAVPSRLVANSLVSVTNPEIQALSDGVVRDSVLLCESPAITVCVNSVKLITC